MPLLRDVEYFNIDFIYIKLRILQYEVFFHLKIPRFLIVWIYRESFFIRNAIIYTFMWNRQNFTGFVLSITQLVLRMYKLFITIAIKRIICVSRCVFSDRSAIIRGHHIIPPFAVQLWYRIASVLACHRLWFKYIFMKLSNEPSKPKLNFLFRIKYVTPFWFSVLSYKSAK